MTLETRSIVPGHGARYATPGYLIFLTVDAALAGARFDAAPGELRGPVVPLVERVGAFSLSETGTLIYAPSITPSHEFVWVGRDGAAVPLAPGWVVEGLVGRGFELSPDESRLALSTASDPGGGDVWVKELPAGPLQKLSSGEGAAWGPRWTASGDRITYSSGATGGRATLSRRSNGTGPVDTLFDGSLDAPDVQLDASGQWLVMRVGLFAGRDRYIAAGRVGPGEDPPAPILGGTYNAVQPALSPDGLWIAYTSDESGRNEVYVRPFPDVGSDRIVVSTDGGLQPRWSRDGRELFYVSASGVLMAARIETPPAPRVVSRQPLFTIPSDWTRLRRD